MAMPLEAPDWREMNQEELDRGLNDGPLSLVAGPAELPLLRGQTADFASHGLPVTYE